MTKLDLVQTQKHGDLAGVLQLLTEQEATQLSHGLDDEYAGHDGRAGIMPAKERFIDRDVLHTDGTSVTFHLDDSINEKHRITMRHDLLDRTDVHHTAISKHVLTTASLRLLADLGAHLSIQIMAGP